jgi:hypothetical protein
VCGFSSENIVVVSEKEYIELSKHAGSVNPSLITGELERVGNENVALVEVLPKATSVSKFYVINTGCIDANEVSVTFSGQNNFTETRVERVPSFSLATTPVEFIVPFAIHSNSSGEVSLGSFSVRYKPRRGDERSYLRSVIARIPPPANIRASCEFLRFSSSVGSRSFRITNYGGLHGQFTVNLIDPDNQWSLSFFPLNGSSAVPANQISYQLGPAEVLRFQVTCNGSRGNGYVNINWDGHEQRITLGYESEVVINKTKQPVYMVGVDLGTRQTSAVVRYIPVDETDSLPVMVNLSNQDSVYEERVETKISIGRDGAVRCGTDVPMETDSDLVIHELKSLLYEASQNPDDKDYGRWWTANEELRRFTYVPLPDSTCAIKIDQLFRGDVTIYERLMQWTFLYVNWLKGKVKETIRLRSTTSDWPAYDFVTEDILWIFTVPVRDYTLRDDADIPVGYNRYVLTLLNVLVRANWFAKRTAQLRSKLETVSAKNDLSAFLEDVERNFGVRFEVESVAAICGVYNHPTSAGQFSVGLIDRSVYLIDSGGGTTDVVQVNVSLNDADRRLKITPVEILGQDTQGKVFGGELVSSALMAFSDTSREVEFAFTTRAVENLGTNSWVRRVFAEDTKKLRESDLNLICAAGEIRFTWGTLKSINYPSASPEWVAAYKEPVKFVSALQPKTIDETDNRTILTRVESMVDSIQGHYGLGDSVTDDYYVIVGGNSKFVPLQTAVSSRLGSTMHELLPVSEESYDKLREIFVCYGSVFVRDTKPTEIFDYPISLMINDDNSRDLYPGDSFERRIFAPGGKLSIALSTVRNSNPVYLERSALSVSVETTVVRVIATRESVVVNVAGTEVISYKP